MQVILFEDAAVTQLDPIALVRPAYAISCGAMRLMDWAQRLGQVVRGWVRPHLMRIAHRDYLSTELPEPTAGSQVWVNARLVPSAANFDLLEGLIRDNTRAAVWDGDLPLVVVLPDGEQDRVRELIGALSGPPRPPSAWPPTLAPLPKRSCNLTALRDPHDVLAAHLDTFGKNLERRVAAQSYREVRDGVFAAQPDLSLEHVVTDTRSGPVVLESGVTVGPFSFLKGPLYVGDHATICPQSQLQGHVCVGTGSKVGGEIAATIFEPFANKQHYGYLGHAYVGSWVNLGAGTSNSNLKNTYGTVRVTYGDRVVETGMQFLGCVIGDYVKSAVNTTIFTGKIIGVCSMLYGFVTQNVPSFVNYAQSFGQVTELPVEVAAQMQNRMFVRRGKAQDPEDLQLIHDVYQQVRGQRQVPSGPLRL